MNPSSNPILIRKRVVKKALRRTPITRIARQYMVSRNFVYKWVDRYRENRKENGGKNAPEDQEG